jgi:hypothetical protein
MLARRETAVAAARKQSGIEAFEWLLVRGGDQQSALWVVLLPRRQTLPFISAQDSSGIFLPWFAA